MTITTRLYIEPWNRDPRIRELGLTPDGADDAREGLLEIVRAMVAGRSGSTDNNAKSSAGFNAWDYGVRRSREVYRGWNGWEKYDENGIEGIINHRLKIKMAVVSTDSACDLIHSPRNRTRKGPMTEKIVDLSVQGDLFPIRGSETNSDGYQFWELCVSDDNGQVCAELSRPLEFESSYFLKFSERIFLIQPGDWGGFDLSIPGDRDDAEFDPEVRRK